MISDCCIIQLSDLVFKDSSDLNEKRLKARQIESKEAATLSTKDLNVKQIKCT